MQKSLEIRKLDLVVISDIHLGTYGCQSKALLRYLKSIDPKRVILNGDIIDIWQFNKRFWPKSHMKVVKYLMTMISSGTEVHYLVGNHDEMLRKFLGFQVNNLKIDNKLVLDLDGKKAWFFHGDVFDVTMQYSKWLTKLGGIGYDLLILLNSLINFLLEKMGKERLSLSKTVKNKVKEAVKFINKFEESAVEIAARNQYDYVVCGHIHHPNIQKYNVSDREVYYLNSGDWVESLTALEYNDKKWSIYKHELQKDSSSEPNEELIKTNSKLFEEMVEDFKVLRG